MKGLTSSRAAIDEIDEQLLALLARRMEAVREIAGLKSADHEAPLYDPNRERELFERWCREGETLGLSPHFVGRVLRELLVYSRRDQERRLQAGGHTASAPAVRVAYQGAPASYSDLALARLFASRAHSKLSTRGHETFEGVLDALDIDFDFVANI